MQRAVICPVCNGAGKYGETEVTTTTTTDNTTYINMQLNTCHGCSGLGWVTLGVDKDVPYTPTIQPYAPPYYPWTGPYTWTYSGGTLGTDKVGGCSCTND